MYIYLCNAERRTTDEKTKYYTLKNYMLGCAIIVILFATSALVIIFSGICSGEFRFTIISKK